MLNESLWLFRDFRLSTSRIVLAWLIGPKSVAVHLADIFSLFLLQLTTFPDNEVALQNLKKIKNILSKIQYRREIMPQAIAEL